MEIIVPRQPPEPWRELPDDTTERCNCDKGGLMWVSEGGCEAKAAYELVLPGAMTLRNCLEHHRQHLHDQERTGKVQWIKRPLPGGGIEFIRHDPYADHQS